MRYFPFSRCYFYRIPTTNVRRAYIIRSIRHLMAVSISDVCPFCFSKSSLLCFPRRVSSPESFLVRAVRKYFFCRISLCSKLTTMRKRGHMYIFFFFRFEKRRLRPNRCVSSGGRVSGWAALYFATKGSGQVAGRKRKGARSIERNCCSGQTRSRLLFAGVYAT